jgi:hypothetical protein
MTKLTKPLIQDGLRGFVSFVMGFRVLIYFFLDNVSDYQPRQSGAKNIKNCFKHRFHGVKIKAHKIKIPS